MSKQFDVFRRLLDSAVRNMAQSFYDDFVQTNCKTRAKVGLSPKIIRRDDGHCCEWCAKLAGTYEYGDHPADIFRRHKNCTCTVIAKYDKNRYQDVYSKKEFEKERDARINQAKHEEELDKLSRQERIERNAINDREYSKLYRQKIKNSGGKKYIPSDDSIKEQQTAKTYKKISKRNDIKQISTASEMSETEIKTIKRHIFYEKHNLYDGYKIFDVDYDMAVAWERLSKGQPLERDIVLLKHELLEAEYEKLYNHDIAHSLANQKYNWEERLMKECGEKGEKDGLL